jgi:hypothetical protein
MDVSAARAEHRTMSSAGSSLNLRCFAPGGVVIPTVSAAAEPESGLL